MGEKKWKLLVYMNEYGWMKLEQVHEFIDAIHSVLPTVTALQFL